MPNIGKCFGIIVLFLYFNKINFYEEMKIIKPGWCQIW